MPSSCSVTTFSTLLISFFMSFFLKSELDSESVQLHSRPAAITLLNDDHLCGPSRLRSVIVRGGRVKLSPLRAVWQNLPCLVCGSGFIAHCGSLRLSGFALQPRRDKPIVSEDTQQPTGEPADNRAKQPPHAVERSLRANQRPENARAEIAGGVDHVTAWPTQ